MEFNKIKINSLEFESLANDVQSAINNIENWDLMYINIRKY